MNHKEELLRGLWVNPKPLGDKGQEVSDPQFGFGLGFRV